MNANNTSDELIRLENITKRFGGVTALEDVSFSINRGEVHAIVGENGAGKSTLMKLLAGVQEQDEGSIYINGDLVRLSTPEISEKQGIAMVFQELNLFLPLTVAANIFIKREIKSGNILLNEIGMCNQASKVLDSLLVDINPKAKISSLSTGQRQIVEIARAINRGTNVVIMDEPNSALNEHETKALFEIINNLKQCGITILYVSHRLEEVFKISERITVLRDGKYVGTWETEKTNVEEIVSKVVGRRLGDIFPERPLYRGKKETTISLKDLVLGFNTKPIEFKANRGEILGLAGLEGSGVQETLLNLFGLEEKRKKISVTYGDLQMDKINPRFLIKKGWAFIPADRRNQGLMLNWSILLNSSLVILQRLVSKVGLIKHREEKRIAEEYINKFDISTDSLDKKVHNLSGGNQQKVVLAKWMSTEPNVLVLNDPTRGIDVGTKQEIYKMIVEWANQGFTVLFTSSEFDEILGVCDRILVFYKNEIIKEFEKGKVEKEELMRYVLGGAENNIGVNKLAQAV